MFCEWNCGKQASYDFVDKEGNWRFGCLTHWIDNRMSKQLGPGHGRHLSAGIEPEPRPPGTPELESSQLAKPRVAPFLRDRVRQAEPTKAAKIRERQAKRHAHEFCDMEPTAEVPKVVKPGSVIYVALELCRREEGATLEEIQAAIGSGHNALKLLEWINQNKGMGWRRDPETLKIRAVYPEGTDG